MSVGDDTEIGIRILSFDNGGPGTYSQLLILKECMSRMANDRGVEESELYPADYFDLMGGVGFSGFCALMLGHLRMTVDQTIDALLSVASAVFPQDTVTYAKTDVEVNSTKLKSAIEDILAARNVPIETKINEDSGSPSTCKVTVYAANVANLSDPVAFRTYSSRGSSLNPTIVDCICATIAIPALFSPVKFGPPLRKQAFVGGVLGANNPTHQLLKEAMSIFWQR